MATSPQLSIVIPVYNNWWLTARCLRKLERLRGGSKVSFETIVVDNASRDETPEAIENFAWVRYLRNETNRNFAGACNAGVRSAQAPLTFLLNNDAYPIGDALEPLVRAFDRTEVAIAGAALFFEDGLTQAAGLAVLPNAHWHYYCRNLPSSLEAVARSREAIGVSGAAMAVRTWWFLENGGFDETFVNGFEDVDLCLRAREQGREIAYVADARIAHYEAATAGRFDREAENERRFYARWSSFMTSLPRTARGEVGAIEVVTREGDPLLSAARRDLEEALRAFGHPVARGACAPWRRIDRRFRRRATVDWFSGNSTARAPGVKIGRSSGGVTSMRTSGVVPLEVPWLPCAAADRVERLGIRRSDDPSCNVVGIAGDDEALAWDLGGYRTIRITPKMLLEGRNVELACVVHGGLTDDAAFGNVLLAQAGLPAVAIATGELRALFAYDVAMICDRGDAAAAVARLLDDATLRARYGALVSADSRRRFSPRRSAIRVVDLLCAARFGLERPATARSNSPL